VWKWTEEWTEEKELECGSGQRSGQRRKRVWVWV